MVPLPVPGRIGEFRNPPSPPRRQCRIHRQIQRQRHHGDIAEPDWHCRLKGEGNRDPLIAEGKMPHAEQPAKQQCALTAAGLGDEVDQKRKADQRQRPKAPGLEAGRRECASDQSRPTREFLEDKGDFLHRAVFAGSL